LENEKDCLPVVQTKQLNILVTDEDKYGTDVARMSNFFDNYISELTSELLDNSLVVIEKDIPVADIGIISEVLHCLHTVSKGKFTWIPDFESLPAGVKKKLADGVYTIGESRQVDGNARATIIDENGTRVKDITLKKVPNQIDSMDSVRSITNQAQMKMICEKLDGIEEFQTYQLERDRDRDIYTPFLNARHYILLAQENDDEQYRIEQLKNANLELTKAVNGVYTELNTTAKQFAKATKNPVFSGSKAKKLYMSYLTSDLQLATKFAGVQMRVYDYLGDKKGARLVMEDYQYNMREFINKPIGRKSMSAAELLQSNYSYTNDTMDFWAKFFEDMEPVINMDASQIECDGLYFISLEEVADE